MPPAWPGGAAPEALGANFLRLNFEGFSVKGERHTEFTRYSVVQALPEGLDATPESPTPRPGRDGRLAARRRGAPLPRLLVLLEQHLGSPGKVVADARSWFDDSPIVASVMGAVQGPVTRRGDGSSPPHGLGTHVVIAEHATSPRPARAASPSDCSKSRPTA